MNIWDLAKEKLKANEEKSATLEEKLEEEPSGGLATEIKRRHESHVVLCGSSRSGKTSLLMNFLERTDEAKQTVALEYMYGRRTRGNVKDVAHLWELGGGTNLTSLLGVPLKTANIEIASVVVFLDLTKPESLWTTMEITVIEAAKRTIELSVKSDELLKQKVEKAAKLRMEKHGDDVKLCNPFPTPITIICGKYDEFQNLDSDKKRVICQTLRFVAHYYGANLMFYSSRMEQFARLGKNMLSLHAFGTVAPQGHIVDHSKPLFIKCGDDSFEAIGTPSATSATFSRASAPIQLWKESFNEVFSQKSSSGELGEDPSMDPLFREPLIDRLVEQKQKDLELFVRHKRERPSVITENT